VYATDARGSDGIRRIASFPAKSHTPIVYPAALLRTSSHGEARAFLDWLSSDAARAIFRRHGFRLPRA
ncbi:MAG: substrate-binding domain-containing protein, partial [Pacificimonas sp.]